MCSRNNFMRPTQLAASGLAFFLRGSLSGICGAVLITMCGLSSEAWLLSVSKIRKNFSASMAMTSQSLVESRCQIQSLARDHRQMNSRETVADPLILVIANATEQMTVPSLGSSEPVAQ
jgi:hypothetical protein